MDRSNERKSSAFSWTQKLIFRLRNEPVANDLLIINQPSIDCKLRVANMHRKLQV